MPTLDKVLRDVNSDQDLPNFKRTTFFKLLNKIGFKFSKRSRKSLLMEKEEIIQWRRNYLRTIKKYREEKRKIYYTDETWLNEGHTCSKVWKDTTILTKRQAYREGWSTGLINPSGKGKRLIITHIGSDTGFLDGGLLTFISKSGKSDYHDEMNAAVYEEWFKSVLQKILPGSVIVIDNAPYHSRKKEKLPSTAWRKDSIRDWLRSKNIPFEDSLLKTELLQIVKQHKSNYNKYVIDELAYEKGIIVLRLPPYHCELNPIEMIWGQIKTQVAKNNVTFKMKDVKVHFENAVADVTAENWQKCVIHVIKEEAKMWKLDDIIECMVEPLIININGSDESSSDEFDDLL